MLTPALFIAPMRPSAPPRALPCCELCPLTDPDDGGPCQSCGVIKRCGLCGTEYDVAGWDALAYVGVQPGRPAPLELRNCPCGSTLGVFK